MKLTYPACFYEDKETKEYTVIVPDLEGCTSCGKDLPEAIEMAEDAASGWILTSLEDGQKIPKSSDINDIVLDLDLANGKSFVSILSLDISAYAEKYGNNSVRKNLTIPSWLNTFAEKNCLNFSKVLQDALINLYKKYN